MNNKIDNLLNGRSSRGNRVDMKQKITCPICGATVSRWNFTKHKNTKKHLEYSNMNDKIRELLRNTQKPNKSNILSVNDLKLNSAKKYLNSQVFDDHHKYYIPPNNSSESSDNSDYSNASDNSDDSDDSIYQNIKQINTKISDDYYDSSQSYSDSSI